MIAHERVSVPVGGSIALSESLTLAVHELASERPAGVTVRRREEQVQVEEFAEQEFDPKERGLRPYCEVIRWQGVTVLAGLPAMVIAGPGPLRTCELFRARDQDTGFYRMEWLEAQGLLVCVYEGGVLEMSPSGEVLWHDRKGWDDELVGS